MKCLCLTPNIYVEFNRQCHQTLCSWEKNWTFKSSPRGVRAGAIFYSLVATAKANNKDPFEYLKSMLEQLPRSKTDGDKEKLLPWNLELKSLEKAKW